MNLSDLIPFHDDTYRLRVGHLADDLAEREAQAHRIMNDYQNGDREKALKQLRDFSQVPLDLVPIFDQRVQAALHRAQYA